MARTTKRRPSVKKVKQPSMTDRRIEDLQIKFKSMMDHQASVDKSLADIRNDNSTKTDWIGSLKEQISELRAEVVHQNKKINLFLKEQETKQNTATLQDTRPISRQLWELWQSRNNGPNFFSDIDDIDELQEFFNIILSRNTADKWDKIGSTIAKIRHSS